MGTPPQTVVRAAQPCLPSSSLVPLPQHRRAETASATLAEHPAALLPLQQTSPSLSGSSLQDQPPRRTVMLRERLCWLGTRQCLSLPPPRSSSLRARALTSASSLLLPSPRCGRRLRRRLRRTCPP